ncbi:hypothetical protein PENSPDRAFT_685340 [Peniophora sp. CONT]|nr:hypothetical protein PENSPDRAFT_685340 [Peniophora sp. CONT]
MFSSSPEVDPALRVSAVLGPHHIRYLQSIWDSNPGHFPSMESRRRWAIAHDLLPVAVHSFYWPKKRTMARLKQKIPREEFELGLPEPRLQPTVEELESMRVGNEIRREREREREMKAKKEEEAKVNVKKQERYSTAPACSSNGEQRITRAFERKLRAQSLDSDMHFSDDATSSSPSSPMSEFSNLSLDHIFSGRSEHSATEYDGASECDIDEDMPMVRDRATERDDAVCCDACELMGCSGLVPDTPSNIWDDSRDFAFWAHFEARAYSRANLNKLRDAYEQSGLASTSSKGRVYPEFVWRTEEDITVKEEEMVVESLLFSDD